jgi:small conductance mechanosensitive channel
MATTPIATGSDVIGSSSQIDFTNLLPTILEKFLAVIGGALIIAAGFLAIRYIRAKMHKIESAHEMQRNAINLFEKITSGFIVVIVVTLALKIIGLDMTLLVSVAILGLSYGLQDIIKNYVAGILILFKAPFKIGDVVKIRDFTGTVAKMDFQSTTLNSFDNKQITIYNSDVMTQSIINYTNNTIRRLDMDVTVGYGSDVPKALQIFNQILDNDVKLLKIPKHSIVFKKYSDSGVIFTLKFWVQRPCNILKIRTGIATQIAQAFDEEAIMSPYTKDVQTEEEPQLSKMSDKRRTRIVTFYNQPTFAPVAITDQATAAMAPTGTPEEQASAEISALPPDFEEPEA